MIRNILDKNGSAWPIARERNRERIKKEKKKKDCRRCTRILYPCQWRRNVAARLSLLWKSMAAFIPITMASVQRVYIDREIQAAVMSEACLQSLFGRVRRREITQRKRKCRSIETSKKSSKNRRHSRTFGRPVRENASDSFYPFVLVKNVGESCVENNARSFFPFFLLFF